MDQLPIILISGGSCSGKTIFASYFKDAFVLCMDNYYFGNLGEGEQFPINFDYPNYYNIEGCAEAANTLASGKPAVVPIFDRDKGIQTGTQELSLKDGTRYIIVEGLFAFYEPLRKLSGLKIFLDTPREIRVSRRMVRDKIKGRTDIETLHWSENVEKSHDLYVEPYRQYADVVIPFRENQIRL